MIPLGTSVNIIDDKYLSAKSGRTTTIGFPAYSSCSANLTAAAAAPQDIPTIELRYFTVKVNSKEKASALSYFIN